MTLTQLRTFAAVAATGSVHAAAATLYVSPPAVSASVSALEAELGVALVVRHGRGLELTPQGEVFARYVAQVLGLLAEASQAAVSEPRPDEGRVRLAAVTTAAEHLVPTLLAAFRRRHPGSAVALEVGNRTRVWRLLEDHGVDLAVGGRPPSGPFISLATRANELIVVAAPRRSLPVEGREARTSTVEELAGAVWLLREAGSGTRATAEELFDRLGITPRTLTLGSNGAIRECAAVGLGITLISRDAVARALDAGVLEEWRAPGLHCDRPWHLAARADRALQATVALFVAEVIDSGGWSVPDEALA